MRPRKLLNILPLGVVQTSQAVVGFEHYVVGGGGRLYPVASGHLFWALLRQGSGYKTSSSLPLLPQCKMGRKKGVEVVRGLACFQSPPVEPFS